MRDISDIPEMPDQDERLDEILMDCYGMHEELSCFYTYFEDAPNYPFEAIWRDIDEPGHEEPVTILGVASEDRRGIVLNAKRGDKERRIVAEQVWAKDEDSANATVLNDYRHWINHRGGMSIW